MTSVITKAMVESYALMILVMGMFFLYFCGMVWAFSNPKVSIMVVHQSQNPGSQPPGTSDSSSELTRSTYVRFGEDTESLEWEIDDFSLEEYGFGNRVRSAPFKEGMETCY